MKILHRLLLYLVTPCVVFSLYLEEVSILLRFMGCLGLLMIFVVFSNSLTLSLFLSSRFFIISVNSSGLFLLESVAYARGFSLLCFFGFLNPHCGVFSANSNPLFNIVVGYPLWCKVLCSSLRRVFLKF